MKHLLTFITGEPFSTRSEREAKEPQIVLIEVLVVDVEAKEHKISWGFEPS